MKKRTHYLNQLRLEHVGEQVVLTGWLENVRKVSKNLAFLVMRDFYGKTQVVVEDEKMLEQIASVNCESTILVEGIVRERSAKNAQMETGDIEVVPTVIQVLGKCMHKELPFEVNHSGESDENLRLKYRFLDMRNPKVMENLMLRTRVVAELRRLMMEEGFMEFTTPILTCSSPEGARDYLVPARLHPGQFYALPQAPQQFKQILMASGVDKYFQIAPCFRDEAARADRSPGEFYQLDMEMSFAGQEEVFAVMEKVLPTVFEKFGAYEKVSKGPFVRIPYEEAMKLFGSDKPDLRIDLKITDVTKLLENCGFEAFRESFVKAVVIENCFESRKVVERLLTEVEAQTEKKTYWFKVDENGQPVGGIAKFLGVCWEKVQAVLKLKPNTLVVLAAEVREQQAEKVAGILIKTFGNAIPGHMEKEQYVFCWIVDFPMYEMGEESGKPEFCHNPFSMPQGGMETLKEAGNDLEKLLQIKAYQYDIICNGVELSSGAVRNHDPELMVEAFRVVGLGEEDVKAKFPAMYNAFCYGAPPHAGVAPGVDRMVMLLANVDSIREVIPFPMNSKAQDILMGAPGYVEEKQLQEVHIQVVKNGAYKKMKEE